MVRASHKGRVIHEDGASAPSSFFDLAIRDTSYVCVRKAERARARVRETGLAATPELSRKT